jgi:hypothetical protein
VDNGFLFFFSGCGDDLLFLVLSASIVPAAGEALIKAREVANSVFFFLFFSFLFIINVMIVDKPQILSKDQKEQIHSRDAQKKMMEFVSMRENTSLIFINFS